LFCKSEINPLYFAVVVLYSSPPSPYNKCIHQGRSFDPRKGSDDLNARERILTIRLMEKAAGHPGYAAMLGIVCGQGSENAEESDEPPLWYRSFRKNKIR